VIYVVETGLPYIRKSDDSWVLIDPLLQPPSLTALPNAYAWGSNAFGQIGDYTTVAKSSPVSVVGGFTDWTQVSVGRRHTIGVRANGTAWATGSSGSGQLGDNSTVSKSSPVSVVGGFTDWTQLSAGSDHSLGIRANGTAWAWGSGGTGQQGTGNTTARSSPVSVVGGFTDWIQLSAGAYHSLGVRSNGTAWAWGAGGTGRLGDGTTADKSSPVSVVGGYTDWVQLSAGQYHSLGVRANGTAWGWGNNVEGRLGNNGGGFTNSPVSVVGGFTDWVQVSGARAHSLGVRANGTAWAWGYGFFGALGDNTRVDKSSPVSVVGGFTDWVQVSAGFQRSLGLRANGTAWAWGTAPDGGLGTGTVTARSSPVSIVGGFTDWIQLDTSRVFASETSVGIKGG
jgi:alpha-tubulin suppressor-like RCC1 family protein